VRWKLLSLVILGTIVLILGGAELLDGEFTSRRFGRLSFAETPARFCIFVAGYLLACGFMLLGWLAVRAEGQMDSRLPPKPQFDDPERRRPL
jgi:hypothetical protein